MVTKLLTRLCPLTESEGTTRCLDFAPEPWVLRQCCETGFVYLENPPHYESFKSDFAWERTHREEQERRLAAEPLLYALRSRFKTFRANLFTRSKICELASELLQQSTSTHLNLVELGCGWGGNLLKVMRDLPSSVAARCKPHGIELSSQLAMVADQHLQPLNGSCLHDDALHGVSLFSPEEIDVLIMSSFLEHEINPLPLLQLCKTKLKPGGCIVIKVPNFDCLNRRLRGARWCGFRWPDHVNYFTPRTLKLMAKSANLEVARMQFWDHSPLSDNMYAVLRKQPGNPLHRI